MWLRSLLLVAIVVFITTEAVSAVDVMKAVGDQVSFRPDKFIPSVTSIIWKHRNTVGTVNKAIEWDEGETLIPNLRFKDITTVDEKTGQITITNLKVEHSGVYTIDINSKEQQQRFNLTVMEQVPKPVIKTQKSEDNPDAVNLICEYNEMIIWKNSAGETLKGSKHDPKGETLVVKYEGNLKNFYTCTLKNAVSEETSEPLYERDLERVPKPVIKIEKIKDNPDAVNLICEYSETIIWKNSAGETLKGSKHHPKGEILVVKYEGNRGNFYTCTLKNAVSEETSDPLYERDLERVPKPVIKIEKSKDNPDAVNLICEYSETIIWKNSAGETLKGSKHHPKGETLRVKYEGNRGNFYTCTLKNALSEETSEPLYERDLERVPKPVIKIEKSKDNPDVVNLICEYSETIIWKNSAGETLKGSKHDPKGETLVVKYGGNRGNFYTCTLKNAVSEETSDPLYERDLVSNKGCAVAASIPWITMVIIMLVL
ncbi:uncharacterized protein LOC125272899 isoform X2 [Megalobrama amblycephala]|uniref:uncharacterized protein LOC125272899 isoform X2 n=1 Tax=Megalobrama amblycephala TaxID=75352 RepID=UPI00201422C9|nr:uncharacterized protein LOC125272899 isoform X2 [Megalobrama amblycephala]